MLSRNGELSKNSHSGEDCGRYSVAEELYRFPKLTIAEEHPFDEASIKGLSCNRNDSLRLVGHYVLSYALDA